MQIELSKIKTDGGTQPRAQMSFIVVEEYADAMANGVNFPPVDVCFDGVNYWLIDGFHRVNAARNLGLAEIEANVTQGTLSDAQWASYSVNSTHGLRRTNEDKRRAVEAALRHPKAAAMTNVEVARHCGVSEITIRRYRDAIIDNVEDATLRTVTRNGTTYQMQTGNIGQRATDDNQKYNVTMFDVLPNSADDKKLAAMPIDQRRAVVEKLATGAKSVTDAKRQLTHEARQSIPAPSGKYRIIYADPPWSYGNSGLDDYGHAERHYPALTITELCELPVYELAEDNAVLFMWVTSPLLESCFKVINAWGFRYKTSFVWDKVRHNFGYYNSVRHEFLLVATRGRCTPDVNKLFDSVQSIERSDKHSEKPEEFRNIIDAIYPNGKRIELFARKQVDNWELWGNEAR